MCQMSGRYIWSHWFQQNLSKSPLKQQNNLIVPTRVDSLVQCGIYSSWAQQSNLASFSFPVKPSCAHICRCSSAIMFHGCCCVPNDQFCYIGGSNNKTKIKSSLKGMLPPPPFSHAFWVRSCVFRILSQLRGDQLLVWSLSKERNTDFTLTSTHSK